MTEERMIGVVGLGNMGRGMALSLMRGGFAVLGLDKNPQTAERANADGVNLAADLAEIVRRCETIVLSLPNSSIVKELLVGDGGIQDLAQRGLMIIDTTTADPEVTRELASALKLAGIVLLDAPVSGGSRGALRGELTMFLGGSEADVDAARPVLSAMGGKLFHIGDTGAGNIAKIVNNLLTASHLLTASEAFRMAEAAGVKTGQLLDAVNAGSGRSGVTLYNYPSRILSGTFDSGFTMQLMRKDVALAVSLYEKLGVDVPVTRGVGQIWSESASALADGEDFNRIVNFRSTAANCQ
ncbi:3-hydroxyisobutyrate dehydrogenase [Telmatospirillum siberiense]|uniref:3-hydroxyisobutyrate dehydrogenase n=2 Tax=Telmatospirillum siberiense TaxID=382514 RepID=A0A2N3PZ26_9PROT|nr:NAD(P)-dependent oxidoreductase [Telmatospirillum siberiense]PKU25648.1 3-hydroxyisobutyrate dehydrogenase [Telmatospirillum siberiense]